VTVEFAARRFTAIMGPSGSGKSTLMHSVAGLNTQRAQICRSVAAERILFVSRAGFRWLVGRVEDCARVFERQGF
jgi:ABC-type Mn2+/Zn2+ transport system ATPase subunit